MTPFTIPFFGCFLIFIIWFAYERKKHSKLEQKRDDEFWQREHEANFARRKNLDIIEYVKIPYDSFPIGCFPDDEAIACAEAELLALKDARILNLTGKTATDLKLEYGPANLTALNEYDENYTLLVKVLQKYAEALCSLGHVDEAVTVLEFAVATGSDLKATFLLLADIYKEKGLYEKIPYLSEQASKLDSLMKNSIINALKQL